MSALVPVSVSPYRDQLRAEHLARRARWRAAALVQRGAEAEVEVEAPAAIEAEQQSYSHDAFLAGLVQQAKATIEVVAKRWPAIAAEVCHAHGVTFTEVCASSRVSRLVRIRHEIFYRLATETSMGLYAIGQLLGGRDHTTALHGCRQHALRNGLPVPVGTRR